MSKNKTIIKKITINNYPSVTSEELQNSAQEGNSALGEDGYPKDMPEYLKGVLKRMGLSGKSVLAHGNLNVPADEKSARGIVQFIHDLIHSNVIDKTDILNMIGAAVCPNSSSLEDIYKLAVLGKDALWTPEALKFLSEYLKKPVPEYNFIAANIRRTELRAKRAKEQAEKGNSVKEEDKKEEMPIV